MNQMKSRYNKWEIWSPKWFLLAFRELHLRILYCIFEQVIFPKLYAISKISSGRNFWVFFSRLILLYCWLSFSCSVQRPCSRVSFSFSKCQRRSVITCYSTYCQLVLGNQAKSICVFTQPHSIFLSTMSNSSLDWKCTWDKLFVWSPWSCAKLQQIKWSSLQKSW